MATDPASSEKAAVSLRREIHGSVAIPKSPWRRMLAFAGPAFLVSVGYMDPGNWGTDIEAGSSFSYQLIWVLLMSNLMAILLQSLATRLGVVTGRDLAQACRENYPRPTSYGLWILCEIAIAATDLAEVIGTIIALNLLFDLPYLWGLGVAALDTFALLALQKRGIRLLELLTLALIGVIGVSFFLEIVWARPEWGQVVRGFLPGLDPNNPRESLYIAIGMLGATVMPHNLYLHSALVQTRSFRPTTEGKRQALKYNLFDSGVALNGAFLINAAILIMAGASFAGKEEVETLHDAHRLLHSVLGVTLAPILFAVALLASGQSSTFTGTLAGQVVMEGFLTFRLRPWARRLLTRSVALVPAVLVVGIAELGSRESPADPGVQQSALRDEAEPPQPAPDEAEAPQPAPDEAEAPQPAPDEAGRPPERKGPSLVDQRLLQLLVFSQVVLSFQLPFAIVPLVHFTTERRRMGEFAVRGVWRLLAWGCGLIVVGLNGVFLFLQVGKWGDKVPEYGWNPLWVYVAVGLVAAPLVAFLAWVTLYPILRRRTIPETAVLPPVLAPVRYNRIGVAVEFAPADDLVLAQASFLAHTHGAELVVIHVVEGPIAALHGPASDDLESRDDRLRITQLVAHLRNAGLPAEGTLGYGTPAGELVRIVKDRGIELLVVGSHGHRFLADLALGQTVAPVLHDLTIPVLVVPTRKKGREPVP